MRRTAVYFGVWAALCMLFEILIWCTFIFPSVPSYSLDFSLWLSDIRRFAPYCVPAGVVAGVGWWLLHRGGRRPSGLVYGLFALAIVLVNHVLIMGFLVELSSSPTDDIASKAGGLAMLFLLHGWLTVPVALIGTYLFVVWNRRRGAAAKPQ